MSELLPKALSTSKIDLKQDSELVDFLEFNKDDLNPYIKSLLIDNPEIFTLSTPRRWSFLSTTINQTKTNPAELFLLSFTIIESEENLKKLNTFLTVKEF
jgi:hypothetical protein